ncbi:MAG TPA: hypothetical protein VGE47_10175, partial [Burkholderiaceae bacterium]
MDALAEVRAVFDANHGVPEAIRRHAIDQVDDAVLKPADAQMMQHMDDEQWRRRRSHRQSRQTLQPTACSACASKAA